MVRTPSSDNPSAFFSLVYAGSAIFPTPFYPNPLLSSAGSVVDASRNDASERSKWVSMACVSMSALATWAGPRKVYEADLLECPKCRRPMRVIALIENLRVIRRILEHLGL
jgi:hypothetical protein